jgi:hypothetical protein
MVNFRKILLKDHIDSHQSLDKLISNYIMSTGKLLSETTVLELLQWSSKRIDRDHLLIKKSEKEQK